jgi:DNA repair exonuclease SbcCD ATPase subunit
MSEQSDRIAQLEKDVELWRQALEKAQADGRESSAKFVQRSRELVEARDRLASAEQSIETLVENNIGLRNRLINLLEHTAGRSGNLKRSQVFCSVCENPLSCPVKETWEYLKSLGQNDWSEERASVSEVAP